LAEQQLYNLEKQITMTDKQRDRARVLTLLILLSVILMGALSGCSQMLYKSNRPVVTHVFALTNQGDTIKIPINKIQPQRVYNVIGYDYYNPYDMYYNRYRNNWYDRYYDYNRNYNHNYGVQSSGFKIHYSNISPSIQPSSSGVVSGSGTSGGGGNPVAVNPVTSTGGAKKNN